MHIFSVSAIFVIGHFTYSLNYLRTNGYCVFCRLPPPFELGQFAGVGEPEIKLDACPTSIGGLGQTAHAYGEGVAITR